MQSYASHILLSLLRCCSCLLMQVSSNCTAILLCQLVLCSGLLQSLLYHSVFAVHARIACLCCVCWDSVFSFPTYDWSQMHAGIVFLAFLAYDVATACRDSLSTLLHAGIACLPFLASDWVTACWDSMVVLSMLG